MKKLSLRLACQLAALGSLAALLLVPMTRRGILSVWHRTAAANAGSDLHAQIHELEAAIRANPKDSAARRQLADAYYLAGLLTPAAAQCREILRLNPRDEQARLSLCVIMERQGRGVAALDLLQEGIRLDPSSARLRLWVGRLLVDMGRYADARPELLAVLRIDHGELAAQASGLLEKH